MKKRFIVNIFIFLAIFAYSDQSTDIINNNHFHTNEFNIGGAINIFGFYNLFYYNDDIIYADGVDNYGFRETNFDTIYETTKETFNAYTGSFPYGVGMNFTFSASFIKYFNNYFGFGFSSEIGFGLILQGGILPTTYDFYYNLRLLYKIGNLKKRNFLYLENGIDVVGEIQIENIGSNLFGFYKDIENYNNYIYIGPSLLIGLNNISKKGLSFIVGGTFSSIFYYNKHSLDEQDQETGQYSEFFEVIKVIRESFITSFRIGLEFKWMVNIMYKKN